jgi:hypothetical protein
MIDCSIIKIHCPYCDTWFPHGGDIRGDIKLPCPKCEKDIRGKP